MERFFGLLEANRSGCRRCQGCRRVQRVISFLYVVCMHQRPHEKLIAWQESYKLCLSVYKLTLSYPYNERFGLTSQIRRASYSVPMNIAEGNSKRTKKEKSHFLDIALASLEELHCQLQLSKDLDYIKKSDFELHDGHVNRVSYLITKLRLSLQK